MSTIVNMENTENPDSIDEKEIENLVPTKVAYLSAFTILFLSGIAGGLIGYALMKVFFPDLSSMGRFIGTCIICALIVYGVSIITSLGLEASVEWKARKGIVPDKKRPSRLIRDEDHDL